MREVCMVLALSRKDSKGLPEMFVDKNMKRGDFKYLYFDKLACCKWVAFSNNAVQLREWQ